MTSSEHQLTPRYRDSASMRRRSAPAMPASLLAVSKTQPAAAIRAPGRRSDSAHSAKTMFRKRWPSSANWPIWRCEWHLIGPLQSNKCREVAEHFDWLQSLDREKLIAPLNRYRPDDQAPLNVLIQVNIDAEASKSGCAPEAIPRPGAAHRRGAAPAPARLDGDSAAASGPGRAARRIPAHARPVRCAARRSSVGRHAVAGHVRRLRTGDRGRCDAGAGRSRRCSGPRKAVGVSESGNDSTSRQYTSQLVDPVHVAILCTITLRR